MELSDHLREMLKELGQAINESISGSGRVHDSIQRIRDEGYNLYMVLDAKVGVNRREARLTRVRRGAARELQLEDAEETQTPEERAAFRITAFSGPRSTSIDPTAGCRPCPRLSSPASPPSPQLPGL
jgi:hypothetical protein